MSDAKKVQNTKDNSEKKYFVIFMVIMVLSLIGGFFVGFMINIAEQYIDISEDKLVSLKVVLAYLVPAITVVANVVTFVIALVQYLKIKKMVAHWDGEEEETILEIEYKLNFPVLIANAMMICNMVLFSVGTALSTITGIGEDTGNVLDMICVWTFVVGLVFEFIILKLVIDLEKKLNPEKRGSIFDVNFAKKWEDSCDEAQKLVSYKAGYEAYKAGSTTCMILWLLAFIGQMMFDTGVFPVICIGIIWLVMLFAYCGFCIKAEKYKK